MGRILKKVGNIFPSNISDSIVGLLNCYIVNNLTIDIIDTQSLQNSENIII
jgi:hypothetical protein